VRADALPPCTQGTQHGVHQSDENAVHIVEEHTQHPLWLLAAGHEAAIGSLVHAYLARMGDDGVHAWSAHTLTQRLPTMQRQLTRAGVAASQAATAAAEVLQTLLATLEDTRGRWLLSQTAARREWPLIDAAGKVSVIDLALSEQNAWLIVDYKTACPQPNESAHQFAARMRLRYRAQLMRYCAQLTALDGRPARAVLYFARAKTWIKL
jgi:ATP-dependent exoDNAse (exonuclease V) beta subunit